MWHKIGDTPRLFKKNPFCGFKKHLTFAYLASYHSLWFLYMIGSSHSIHQLKASLSRNCSPSPLRWHCISSIRWRAFDLSNFPKYLVCILCLIFFNWDSLHAGLNSYYEAWNYKKKKHKKIKVYRKSFLERSYS